MCQNADKCINRASLLTFLIPFLIGGIWFSFVGLAYLDTLPPAIVSVYDRIYACFLAFFDMGSAFGIGSFTCLSLFRQIKSLIIKNRRSPDLFLNGDS